MISLVLRSRGVLIFLCVLVLGFTTLFFPRSTPDAGTYTYIGRTILEGGTPYRDAWDVKGPGIFFAYALSTLLFGASHVALRIFDLLWQFFTAWCLVCVGARIFGRQIVGLIAAIAYLITYYSRHISDLANADGFLSLPLALGVIFLLRALDADRTLFWALAGASVGVAALFKLPMGILGIAMVFAVRAVAPSALPSVIRRLSALALGFTVPLLSCGVYLYVKGGFFDFLTTQFVLAPEYVSRARAHFSIPCLVERALRPSFLPLYVIAILGLSWLSLHLIRRGKVSVPTKLVAAWLGTTGLVFFWQAKFHSVHSLSLVAPLALLSATPIYLLFTSWSAERTLPRLLLFGVLGLCVLVPIERARRNVQLVWSNNLHPRPSLGKFIRQHTSPQDRVFVWGNAPQIYLEADRKSSSRFIHTYFLSISWHSVNYRGVFLAEFVANKPAYFVLIKDEYDDPCSELNPGSYAAFRSFTALRETIEAEYEVEHDTEQYTLFRRRKLLSEARACASGFALRHPPLHRRRPIGLGKLCTLFRVPETET